MEALRLFLQREGHQVYVFAPRYPGYRDGDGFVCRLPSITLPAKVRFPLALPVLPGLYQKVQRLGIDVFHIHHPFGIAPIAQRLARRTQRPLVVTLHTQYEHYLHYIPLPPALVKPAMRWALVRICHACQAITTPAQGMVPVIRNYGVQDPVSVVPNGVDLHRFRTASGEAVRRRYGLGPEAVVALFTGRVAPEKNLPALLEASSRVAAQHPQFRLVILGDGPALPALQRQALAMGLAGTVLFPGAVPHEEVPPYCRMADLFVTSSITEVNPTSVIEAMAAGTPVVAYDTFSVREIVHHREDGLLTEHTPEALAQALAFLVADGTARKAMAQRAAQNAERFSLETTGRQMLAVYEEAMARLRMGRQGRDG